MIGRRRDSGRPLTPGERALVQGMFGAAIDSGAVRLHHRAWWPLQPRAVAMAPDGDIWFHPHGTLWRDDFATAEPSLQALFVHEMTHVWQAQRGGRWFLPLARHPFCRYRYAIAPGRPFARYGIEQQAMIVEAVFRLRRGDSGSPRLAAHEALLPFGTA